MMRLALSARSPLEVVVRCCALPFNNAVHPGDVSLDEDTELISTLFEILNLIVEHVVSRPRQVQVLFEKLPEGARVAIQQRDGT